MKKLIPLVLALLGLGAGMAAGLALKPAPVPEAAPETKAAADHAEAPADAEEHAEAATEEDAPEGEFTPVPISKPFVIPIFRDQAIVAMVVVSVAVEVEPEAAAVVTANEPKLRDGFLKVMFRHANTGGFDGSFTSGQKLEDLKAALGKSLRVMMPEPPTGRVLITEIARQDT